MAKAVVHIQVKLGAWMKDLQAALKKTHDKEFVDMRAMMKYMQQQTYYFSTNMSHAFRNPINAAIEASKMYFSGFMISTDRIIKKTKELWTLHKTLQSGKRHLDLFGGTKADYQAMRGIRDQLRSGFKSLPMMGLATGITAGSAYVGGKSIMAAGGLRLGWEALNQYRGLEQTLTTIKAIQDVGADNGNTVNQFKMLENEIKRLGETTSWTQQQIAGAAEVLSRGGFSLQETMDSLATVAKVAKATNAPLDQIADQMLTIMRTFNLDTKSAQRLGDMMVKTTSSAALNIEQLGQAMIYAGSTANASGRSVEDVFTEIAALANIGIRGSMQGTVLNNIATRAAGNKKARALYETLGISPYEENGSGNIKNLVELAKEMRDAMDRLGWTPKQQTEGYWAGWGIYGQKGAALGTVDLDPLRKAIVEGSDGAADKQAKRMDETLNGLWAIAMSQVSSGFTEGGKGMAPFIEDALKEWTNILGPNLKDQIIAMFQGVTDDLSARGVLESFNEIAQGATALGKACLEVATQMFTVATWMADPKKWEHITKEVLTGGQAQDYDEGWKGRDVTTSVAAEDVNAGILRQFQSGKTAREEAQKIFEEEILEYVDESEAGGYAQAVKDLQELDQRRANYEIDEPEYNKQKREIEARKGSTLKGLRERLEEAEKSGDTISQKDIHDEMAQIGERLKVYKENIDKANEQMVGAGNRAIVQYNDLQQVYLQRRKEMRINEVGGNQKLAEQWKAVYAEAEQQHNLSDKNLFDIGVTLGYWKPEDEHGYWLDYTPESKANARAVASIGGSEGTVNIADLDKAMGTMQGIMQTLENDEALKSIKWTDRKAVKGFSFESNQGEYDDKFIDKLIKGNTKVNPIGPKDLSKEGAMFQQRYVGGANAAVSAADNADFLAEMQKQFDELMTKFNAAEDNTAREKLLIELLNSNWSKELKQPTTGFTGKANAFPSLTYDGRQIMMDYNKEKGGGYASEVEFVKGLVGQYGLDWSTIREGADNKGLDDITFSYDELLDQMKALTEEIANTKHALENTEDEVTKKELISKLDGLATSRQNLADAIIANQNSSEEGEKAKKKKSDTELASESAEYQYNKRMYDTLEAKRPSDINDLQYEFDQIVSSGKTFTKDSLDALLNFNSTGYDTDAGSSKANLLGFLKYNGVSIYDLLGTKATGADLSEQFAKYMASRNGIQWSSYEEDKAITVLDARIADLTTSLRATQDILIEKRDEASEYAAEHGGELTPEMRAELQKIMNENQRIAEERDKAMQAKKEAEEKAKEDSSKAKDSASYIQYATSALWLKLGAGKDPKLTVMNKMELELAKIVANTGKFNKKDGSWQL